MCFGALANAHSAQACNNFKDASVQLYGGGLFRAERDVADDVNDRPLVPGSTDSQESQLVAKESQGSAETKQLEEPEATPSPPAPPREVLCMVCYEPINGTPNSDDRPLWTDLSCRHSTCNDCLRGNCAAVLSGGDVTRLICPHPDCRLPLDDRFLAKLFSPEVRTTVASPVPRIAMPPPFADVLMCSSAAVVLRCTPQRCRARRVRDSSSSHPTCGPPNSWPRTSAVQPTVRIQSAASQ